jgi:hypothetical protein
MIYYVALPFVRVEGGLAPGEAVECPRDAAASNEQALAFGIEDAPYYGCLADPLHEILIPASIQEVVDRLGEANAVTNDLSGTVVAVIL